MQFIMSNIFNLIKNFIDIINNKHCPNMCAKYYSYIINDVHTIYPANIVGLPANIVWPTTFFFEKENNFCTAFVSAIGQPTQESAHKVYLENNI